MKSRAKILRKIRLATNLLGILCIIFSCQKPTRIYYINRSGSHTIVLFPTTKYFLYHFNYDLITGNSIGKYSVDDRGNISFSPMSEIENVALKISKIDKIDNYPAFGHISIRFLVDTGRLWLSPRVSIEDENDEKYEIKSQIRTGALVYLKTGKKYRIRFYLTNDSNMVTASGISSFSSNWFVLPDSNSVYQAYAKVAPYFYSYKQFNAKGNLKRNSIHINSWTEKLRRRRGDYPFYRDLGYPDSIFYKK